MSKKIEKLLKDTYLANNVPESIHIPPLGENLTDVTKPIEQATLDDIAFAAQALDQKADALNSTLYALRRLYREARSKGAVGSDNIVDAIIGKKGGV
jgi:hypothetical protein